MNGVKFNMRDDIKLFGISTHNLKNIDIKIPLNKITTIYGRSGAGKSSLAFSSLYQLCHDEFEALENGFTENSDYIIQYYEGLIPAVAISQKNTNNNPRSTLYSYLNIPQILSTMKAKQYSAIPDFHLLKINKTHNECEHCLGLGEKWELSEDNIIDQSLSLSQKPFYCWKSGSLSDYYHQLLLTYCEQQEIDVYTKFYNLSNSDKHKVLYGESDEKLEFKFKHNNKLKPRKDFYKGVMLHIKDNENLKSIEKYSKKTMCLICHGARINVEAYKNVNIFNILMQDFLLLSIDELVIKLKEINESRALLRVLDSICEMGMGYLNLARSIPSLSGGELQKLKFSKLLNSNISGVLIVIDEISSQINENDFLKIWMKIQNIIKKNTVVLVEHAQFFIDNADNKIHIGYQAGYDGGKICNYEIIQPFYKISKKNSCNDFIEFINLNKNNVLKQSIKIPKKCLTVFTGPSGSGKSSLAKAIFEQGNAIYISQKNSNYSSRSILSSSIQISILIAEYFAQFTGLDVTYFSPTQDGGCKNCNGIGVVKYERGYEQDLYLTCPVCEGDLFDKYNINVLTKICEKNIIDIYKMEIGSLLNFFNDDRIKNLINTMVSLGLSHLQLKRKTQTLSGGELRRVKLCESLSRQRVSKKILIIDEPAAGLDPETASKVVSFIYNKVHMFESIILIEHRPEVIKYADYEVTIGPGSGRDGGKVLKNYFK
ncbi:ATP-binding cassette domain-containing protein [Acinetobacter parvus]|nr:ATP-binding cassette domain-containing protein [Acinetobacter parvus]